MKGDRLKKILIFIFILLIAVSVIIWIVFLKGSFTKKNLASLLGTVALIIAILDNIEIVISFLERFFGITIGTHKELTPDSYIQKANKINLLVANPRPLNTRTETYPDDVENILSVISTLKIPISLNFASPPTLENFRKKTKIGYDIIYYDGFLTEKGIILEDLYCLESGINVEEFAEIIKSTKDKKPSLLILAINNKFEQTFLSNYAKFINKSTGATTLVFSGDKASMSKYRDRLFEELLTGASIMESDILAKKTLDDSGTSKFFSILYGKKNLKLKMKGSVNETVEIETMDWFHVPNPVQTPFFIGEYTGNQKKMGRLDMMYQTIKWILDPQIGQKLVLLRGDGGFGKTALAFAAAKRLAPYFRGGCLWFSGKGKSKIDLNSFLDDTFGVILGETLLKAQGETKKQLVVSFLRNSSQRGTPVLIIADNIEFATKEVWDFLLSLPESTAAIVTTREVPNDVPITNILHVNELTTEEAREMFTSLVGHAEILKDEVIQTVIRLTKRVPAVIEFTARDIKMRGLSATIESLERHPSRKLTTRFDFTYEPLDVELKKFLWLLSVIPGSFNATLVKRLSEYKITKKDSCIFENKWLHLWNSLLDEGQWVRSIPDLKRYEMHPVVRDYLRNKAKISDMSTLDLFERRFTKTLLEVAKEFENHLKKENASLYVNEIGLERENFLGAQEIAFTKNMLPEVIEFSFIIDTLFKRSGHWSDRWNVLDLGLKAAKTMKDKYNEGRILNLLGILAKNQDLYEDALKYFNNAQKIFSSLNKEVDLAKVLVNIGNLHLKTGQWNLSEEFYNRAYNFYKKREMKYEIATVLINLGVLYFYKYEYDKAKVYFDDALKLYSEINSKEGIASVLENLGFFAGYEGDYENAKKYLLQALRIKEEIGDKKGLAVTFLNLGVILGNEGNYGQAEEYYHKTIKILETIGNKKDLAKVYRNMGIDYLSQQLYEKAQKYFEKALEISEDISDKLGWALTMYDFGNLALQSGNYKDAINYYKKALLVFRDFEKKDEIATILKDLSKVANEIGYTELSLNFLALSLKLSKTIKNYKKITHMEKDLLKISKKLGLTNKESEKFVEDSYNKYLRNPESYLSNLIESLLNNLT